jgi:hypothetical protein
MKTEFRIQNLEFRISKPLGGLDVSEFWLQNPECSAVFF